MKKSSMHQAQKSGFLLPPPPTENEERDGYRYKLVLGFLILIRQVTKCHSSGSGGGGKHDALAPPPVPPTHTHTHTSRHL